MPLNDSMTVPMGDTMGAPADDMNPIIRAELEGKRTRFRATVSGAVAANPDDVARQNQIASYLDQPRGVVAVNPQEAERSAAIKRVTADSALSPVLQRKYTDADFAKLAHDDSGPLSAISSASEYLWKSGHSGLLSLTGAAATLANNVFGTSEADLATLYKKDPSGLQDMLDNSPATFGIRFARSQQQGSQDVMQELSPAAQNRYGSLKYSTLEEDKSAWRSPIKIVGDAIQSLPSSLAMGLSMYLTRGAANQASAEALAAGLTPAAARAAGTLAAEQTMARVGAGSEGAVGYSQQYNQTREDADKVSEATLNTSDAYKRLLSEGYDPKAARLLVSANAAEQAGQIGGIVDAAVNFVGGKFLGRIIGQGGKPLAAGVKGAATEAATEGIQSPGEQFGQNWAMRNMDPTQDLSDGVLESMLQGLAVGGFSGGAMTAVTAASARNDQQTKLAQQAEQHASVLEAMQTTMQASKLLARSPETLTSYAQELVDDGAPNVYLDSAKLVEAGVDLQALAQVMPSLASQLDQAQSGADLVVPTGEFLAGSLTEAGSVFSQPLVEHARTDASGMSRADAKAYMAEKGDALNAEIERVLQEKESDTEFKAGRDQVQAELLTQLNEVKRFTPKVNEQYATLASNFYAVMAARSGMTVQKFAETYQLGFSGQTQAGAQVLGQALKTQPPAGWEHVSGGEAAAALWRGEGSAKAVFWTDLDGKLSGDANELTGYSHSISQDTMAHIRKQHGDTANEARRGQVAIGEADLAAIPEVVTQYDAIRTDLMTDKGSQRVAYAKRVEGGVLVYVEDVSRKRSDMRGTTLWKFKEGTDPTAVLATALKQDARKTKGQETPSLLDAALRPLSDYESDAQTPSSPDSLDQSGDTYNQPAVQTDTHAFKKWFGKSKVVDAEGKPLVVYHGTASDFDSFSSEFQGTATRATSSMSGFFFSSSTRTAKSYADHAAMFAPVDKLIQEADAAADKGNWDLNESKNAEAEALEAEINKDRGRGQNLVPTYLSLQNPLVLDAKGENPQGIGGIDKLIKKAQRAGHDGVVIRNFDDSAGLSNDISDHYIVFKPTQIKSAIGNSGAFDGTNPSILQQDQRGQIAFANVITQQASIISMFKAADLSTFIHEGGHFFLEVQSDLAAKISARISQGETVTDGERSIVDDFNTTLTWMGVKGSPELSAIDTWYLMTADEKRPHHEQFARGFEAYAFEGKSPSIELTTMFQTFRSWLVNVYRSVLKSVNAGPADISQAMNAELSDEVRSVMDRMLATSEQIEASEAARNMGPLFTSAEEAGMDLEAYKLYHDMGTQATMDAVDELQAKGLKDMQWLSRARSRTLKSLQKQHNALRAQIAREVRRSNEPADLPRLDIPDGQGRRPAKR